MYPLNDINTFWAPIPGFADYAISDKGDAVSYKKSAKGKLMKPSVTQQGYPRAALMQRGFALTKLIHRLVYEAFRGPTVEGMQVMHLDGNPRNSNLSNLREGTPLENSQMKAFHGTQCHGVTHGRAKLTEEDVLKIRATYPKLSYKMLGDLYGVSDNQIMLIVKKRSWTHV